MSHLTIFLEKIDTYTAILGPVCNGQMLSHAAATRVDRE